MFLSKTKLIVFLSILTVQLISTNSDSAEIWVAPNGADRNPGTHEAPLGSVNLALRKARELRRIAALGKLSNPKAAEVVAGIEGAALDSGIHIILKTGLYPLEEPLLVRPEDSGTAESPTVIEAAPGEFPVLSGGVRAGNWRLLKDKIPGLPAAARGKVWSAEIPRMGGRALEFRQLWVNGNKAVRAREPDGAVMQRILAMDREHEVLWIPPYAELLAAENEQLQDAAKVKPAITKKKRQAEYLLDPAQTPVEMVIHQRWAIANLRIASATPDDNGVRLTFQQPESRIEFEHPWPQPVISKKVGNSAFYLTNSVQFLDQPGEWYLDQAHGRIIYWPRAGEELTRAEVIVPALESLAQVCGTLDRPVEHVHFKGIGFEHATWLRPSQQGHVPLQAGMYLLDAYKLKIPGLPEKAGLENQAWIGRPPAGVTVSGAKHTRFERCKFQHMAACGLDYVSGTSDDEIIGCTFRDIGGNAIQLGAFPAAGFETHVPYAPADKREVCTSETIANNLITDATNEDWGCVGICVGYAAGVNIEHNEVSHVNYSGISLGWGWTKLENCMRDNRIFANHVHHFAKTMYDVGGIYTLSNQPGTVIAENSLHDLEKAAYAHDPEHCQFIYFDEGSSNITARDNWLEYDKVFTNQNGPGTHWENNGPQVAEEIKNRAGLQPEFLDLLNE